MTDKCKECEKEVISDMADLQMKYDRALKHIEILNDCLDTKERLNDFYRRENNELNNRIRILENDR